MESFSSQSAFSSWSRMKFFCSILAATSILVAHHVIEKEVEVKTLSPEMKDLCELGTFHSDCKEHNVH